MIRGAVLFVSWEHLSGLPVELSCIGSFMLKEGSRAGVEQVLRRLGCSHAAISWLEDAQDDFGRRGVRFRFCCSEAVTYLPLCSSGARFMEVSIEDLNRYCGSFHKLVRDELVSFSLRKTYRRVIDWE